jgi:UDP-N-acetylmuramoylalanine--D-glutamate ligase
MRIAGCQPARGDLGLGRRACGACGLAPRLPELPLTVFCSAPRRTLASNQPIACHQAPTAADLSAFVVIKSPGISAYRAELLEAQRNGTRFTSATALWFAEHAHSRVIAVTGTKGKSTTSALIAHLLRSLGRRTALAGNIGLPVLELLDPPQEPDWWVIELSSFQTPGGPRPRVITNVGGTPRLARQPRKLCQRQARTRRCGAHVARPWRPGRTAPAHRPASASHPFRSGQRLACR